MEMLLSWTAAEVAANHRIHTPYGHLFAVEGLWGRVCADIGWMDALRRATSAEGLRETLIFYRDAMRSDIVAALPNCPTVMRIVVADDVCTSVGWVLDPELVTSVLLDEYHTLIDEAMAQVFGKGTLEENTAKELISWGFHSDGDISELYPAIAAIGFSFVHIASVDYALIGRVASAATAAGLTPIGGIAAETLSAGNLSDDLCRQIAGIAHREGLIVCDDAGITTADQLRALLNAYSRLPLY